MTSPSHLCRVEYWNGSRWFLAHAGIALLDPASYRRKLDERGMLSRVTELDDRLQPSVVHESDVAAMF